MFRLEYQDGLARSIDGPTPLHLLAFANLAEDVSYLRCLLAEACLHAVVTGVSCQPDFSPSSKRCEPAASQRIIGAPIDVILLIESEGRLEWTPAMICNLPRDVPVVLLADRDSFLGTTILGRAVKRLERRALSPGLLARTIMDVKRSWLEAEWVATSKSAVSGKPARILIH